MAVLANFLVLTAGLTLLSLFGGADAGKRMVCYYGGWSPYRPGNGQFVIENIDPNLCTHAIYGFAGLNEDATMKVYDPWMDLPDDYGKAGYRRFNDMRKVNPNLKTLIAIGGWNEGSVRYSQVFNSAANRARFVADAVRFVQKYGFNGLDLDWEYPGQRGGVEGDVESFTELIKALRVEFNKYGLLLTAAVASAESSFSQSYDIPALGQYLDFINVMTYDYHGAWENVTGHNAPLRVSSAERGTPFEGWNAESSIQAWLKYGGIREKLNMGVGLYGRVFTLVDPNCRAVGCASSGPGRAGPATAEAGMLGYHEICQQESSGSLYWDSEQQVPYLVFGDQWVGYDNEESARLKVEFIKNNNLGGAMIWSIDTDDFRGLCGKGTYPILRVLKAGMDSATNTPPVTVIPTQAPTKAPTQAPTLPPTETPVEIPTAAPTTAAPAPTEAPTTVEEAVPTTPAPSSSDPCKKEGYNRDDTNCAVFYQCTLVGNSYTYSKFTCSGGLLFDNVQNVCNFASAVQC